ncbi:unnamed protein product [Lymnaea stagnalis]|uniref:Methyltransferase domain-containing protein n=1 Tax=Lymnaea stagnalis TaxID=6523 RepID=A0AAV2H621_LYMST
MPVRLRRKALLAYILSLSSCCFILWFFMFISYDQSLSPLGRIDLTAEDRINFPHEFEYKHSFKSSESRAHEKSTVTTRGVGLIPSNALLSSMQWSEVSELYHKYLSANQIVCQNVERLGRVTDGGWDMCNDSQYSPKGQCIVYSFGIADDFSFDNAVVEKFGCEVHSFDPSIDMQTKKRGDKKFFYKLGIADSDRTLASGWSMSRFESIRASLKHMKRTINILKLDIEEWEWEVLPDLLASDHLKSVDQLLIELHQCQGCSKYDPLQTDKEPPRDHYVHMLGILSQLYQQNFRIFHHHDNSACRYLSKFTMTELSACVEIGLVRIPAQ